MPLDTPSSPPPPPPRRLLPISRLSRRFSTVRPPMSRATARFVWISILPVSASLISLVLSLYSVASDREPPAVVMTLPDRVRIAQGADAAWLYLQPRFVNTGDNNRNEIISRLSIEITLLPAGIPATMVWDEQGAWLYDTATSGITWQFVADPGPIVVGPNTPQFPIGLFVAPSGWVWQPGAYHVTVIADRTIEHAPLRTSLELTLTTTDVDVVSDPGGFLREVMTTLDE